MKKRRGKKGQLTIFIIVAILVIAIVALFFAFPKLRTSVGIEKLETPENFIQTCLKDTIQENVEIISSQGGSLKPSPSLLYQDTELQFLCTIDEDLKLCVTQIPFLREHIENEIKKSIEEDVDVCFNSLKENYDNRGYTTNLKKGEVVVELLPQRIVTTINNEFVFSQDENIQRRETFRVILNNNLYELTAIAQNILNWETRYGNADCDYYMDLYSDIKCEKPKRTTDGTVYVLTNKNTNEKFQFASKSLVIGPFG